MGDPWQGWGLPPAQDGKAGWGWWYLARPGLAVSAGAVLGTGGCSAAVPAERNNSFGKWGPKWCWEGFLGILDPQEQLRQSCVRLFCIRSAACAFLGGTCPVLPACPGPGASLGNFWVFYISFGPWADRPAVPALPCRMCWASPLQTLGRGDVAPGVRGSSSPGAMVGKGKSRISRNRSKTQHLPLPVCARFSSLVLASLVAFWE